MTIIRASEQGTCLVDILDNTSNLDCNTFWYNDELYNLVNDTSCGEFLYLYNLGEEIRNHDNALFANAFVIERDPDSIYLRCRIMTCTETELENNIVVHPYYRVGIALQLFCADNITVITEAPVPYSHYPTVNPTISSRSPTISSPFPTASQHSSFSSPIPIVASLAAFTALIITLWVLLFTRRKSKIKSLVI